MGLHSYGVWFPRSTARRGLHKYPDTRLEQPKVVAGTCLEASGSLMEVGSAAPSQKGQGSQRGTERRGHHRPGVTDG